MLWVNVLSTQPSLEAALNEVVDQARSQLHLKQRPSLADGGNLPPHPSPVAADLAFVFVSAAFASEYSRVLPLLQRLVEVPVLVGCSGGGVAGGGVEIEGEPAVTLSLAILPDVTLYPFHLEAAELPDLDSPPQAWAKVLGVEPQAQPQFLLLADGFSSDISDLIRGLDFVYPTATKVGGLASGARIPDGNALFLNHTLYRTGVVGVALSGNIAVDAIVAQGCRPIGQPLRISETERNVILGLEEQVPLQVLQETVQQLNSADRQLVRTSLFAGMVMNEFKENPEPGDFLIRNILGIDPRTGAIAIGDRLRPGQRLQFHLRDAQTSAEDLRHVLERYRQTYRAGVEEGSKTDGGPKGALLFSCLGRGSYLYGEPNHDTEVFQRLVGDLPMGGFFCNGEIGPVGGTTFLHGYTSVFALFRELDVSGD